MTRVYIIGDGSAQMHTLEGLAAAMLVVLVLVFLIEATTITPLTSSAANEHIEAELQMLGMDILTWMDYSPSPATSASPLKDNILLWDGTEKYVYSGVDYVSSIDVNATLNNTLTETLESTLVPWGIAHNVELICLGSSWNTSGQRWEPAWDFDIKKMIWNGNPSDNSVVVSHIVPIFDDDVNGRDYYNNTGIGDVSTDTDFYNLVDVRLTLWRM
jgi:hypothetical protein